MHEALNRVVGGEPLDEEALHNALQSVPPEHPYVLVGMAEDGAETFECAVMGGKAELLCLEPPVCLVSNQVVRYFGFSTLLAFDHAASVPAGALDVENLTEMRVMSYLERASQRAPLLWRIDGTGDWRANSRGTERGPGAGGGPGRGRMRMLIYSFQLSPAAAPAAAAAAAAALTSLAGGGGAGDAAEPMDADSGPGPGAPAHAPELRAVAEAVVSVASDNSAWGAEADEAVMAFAYERARVKRRPLKDATIQVWRQFGLSHGMAMHRKLTRLLKSLKSLCRS